MLGLNTNGLFSTMDLGTIVDTSPDPDEGNNLSNQSNDDEDNTNNGNGDNT